MSNFNFGDLKRGQILKGFQDDIEKARHGVYSDNAQNRRLQRVGQEYGKAAQKKEETGEQSSASEEGVSLQNHARSASEEALKKVANDPTADSQMRKVATQELERRGINIRSKNKAGASSLRDNSVDSDAKENSKFESLGFRKLDNVDLQTYSGVENPDHAYIKQVGNDEDGYDIIAVSEDGKWRVDKYPYNEVDNFESSLVDAIEDVDKVISKYDKSAKNEEDSAAKYVKSFDDYTAGDSDSFDSKGFKAFIKTKGVDSAIKELADYMRNNPVDSDGEQSDITDDEIADTIEEMFDEANINITKKAEKALDKLREGEAEEEVEEEKPKKKKLSKKEREYREWMSGRYRGWVTDELNYVAEDSGIPKEQIDKVFDFFLNPRYEDEDFNLKRAQILADNPNLIAKILKKYGHREKDKNGNELTMISNASDSPRELLLDPDVRKKGIGENIFNHPKLKPMFDELWDDQIASKKRWEEYKKLPPEKRDESMLYGDYIRMGEIKSKLDHAFENIFGK
nr:MAG TPA: hypothetical protein [Caudoviricetes sp.]